MRLSPVVVTPTAADAMPVDKDAVKKHAWIDHDDDDELVDSLLLTAFEWLQPPAGCLRYSIAPQTLRVDLPCWPASGLELPAGPVTSISSVKYFDTANAEQTVDAAYYFADSNALVWKDTFTWPVLYTRPGAVRITYVAGFTATPERIKTAIKACVKHWYDNRDAVAAVGAMNMMPLGVDDQIAAYRVN